MKSRIFTALVEHKPGVLMRVASLFTRRRFNIESISVGQTEDPGIARMTILTQGDDKILEQIEKQLNKIADVIKVAGMDGDKSVCRELCLLKIHAPGEREKSQVIQYTDVFRGRVVDLSLDSIGVEVTGTSEKIDAFIELVKGIGIKVVARTGVTAMERG